jgi:hypothetical protein
MIDPYAQQIIRDITECYTEMLLKDRRIFEEICKEVGASSNYEIPRKFSELKTYAKQIQRGNDEITEMCVALATELGMPHPELQTANKLLPEFLKQLTEARKALASQAAGEEA